MAGPGLALPTALPVPHPATALLAGRGGEGERRAWAWAPWACLLAGAGSSLLLLLVFNESQLKGGLSCLRPSAGFQGERALEVGGGSHDHTDGSRGWQGTCSWTSSPRPHY